MKKVGAAAVLRSRTQNPGKAFIEWEKNEVEGGGVDPRFVVVVVVVPTIPPPTSPPDVDAFASRRPPPPPLPHEGGGDVPNKARFRIDHRALASRPRSIFPRADDRVVLVGNTRQIMLAQEDLRWERTTARRREALTNVRQLSMQQNNQQESLREYPAEDGIAQQSALGNRSR